MNGTPRLRSSYPSTPDAQKRKASNGSALGAGGLRKTLPTVPTTTTSSKQNGEPVIPLSVIDGPSQRLYVTAVYLALFAYRLYDWSKLIEDEADSFWLFMKWVAFDGVFFYGLPELHVPWLEWSSTTTTILFLVHAALNGMLMFRIPLPFEAVFGVLVKSLYDSELSVSENRVKPASILHNSSLIMGRQIINVLPEGSVTLNPNNRPFCVDHNQPSVRLPLTLNQTDPILIELLRIDFTTNKDETIAIHGKELAKLKKDAERNRVKPDSPLMLDYTVKKPGLYRLKKVMEKNNLEVQRRMSDTLVVNCPKASVEPSRYDKCIGDLSDLTIKVSGVPPLKIKYSRTVNRKDESFHFQSLQPDDLVSPLTGGAHLTTLVSGAEEDVSWGQMHTIPVQLNESMTASGKWLYAIDEVHDSVGNVANFSLRGEDGEHIYPKGSHLERAFTVHERPTATLAIPPQNNNHLRVAIGQSTELPLRYSAVESGADIGHIITWEFSPIDTLTEDGDHGQYSMIEEFVTKAARQRPKISKPGLYTLRSITSQHCEGEIREPASILLVNPPKPNLHITSEDIYDKCAEAPIGILVDLDLSGTPPFIVKYEVKQHGLPQRHSLKIDGSRHQLELKPREAGHFSYRFTSIDDAVYKNHQLPSYGLTLEQDVKPPASAIFLNVDDVAACIEEPVRQDVILSGEPPFTLEYELVHAGKRKKYKIDDIKANHYTVQTERLIKGGEYQLALVSVQDKVGCKMFLKDEINIHVRRQRPKVSWSQIESKRTIKTLEGKQINLPIRLEGEGPWHVTYWDKEDPANTQKTVVKKLNNDFIRVENRGRYELLSVRDRMCPGAVDPSASLFEVDWIDRPHLKIADSSGVTAINDGLFERAEVCEGDIDTLELRFQGSPPYHLKYKHHHKPAKGSQSVNVKEIDAALGSVTIPLDTSKAGLQTYDFSELSDNRYDYDSRRHKSLVVQQKVNAKPTAIFSKLGHTHKYCKDEGSGDDVIPITLHGLPPFYLEIDIKHQSSAKPQTIKLANIDSSTYDFRIPQGILQLGTHYVSIRRVRDSRGCQTETEYGAPTIPVQVFDVPTIYALETRNDYCVGDRISYTLSGTPPFEVYYTFNGQEKKAKSPSTAFRRIAEKPGVFTITAISDRASECKATVGITKTIHPMPSVRISQGRQVSVDIHEGGETEILFEFWGTPPFEFTYTRSTNARKGQKAEVLETRHDTSYEYSKTVKASLEGTYEVVAIKDAFCSFSTMRAPSGGQKLLQN